MAKTIANEKLVAEIVINGNQAQKELFELDKSLKDLQRTQKDLRAEKARLTAEGKKNSEQYKNISQELKNLSAEITKNKARQKELVDELGNVGLTMAQLRSKANQLKIALLNSIPGSEAFIKYKQELDAVNLAMNKAKGSADGAGLSIGKLADGFNRYAALGASAIAAVTGVAYSIQKIIDFNGKLSDAVANVQKTTGMSKDEVEGLAKSFSSLNTRTSKIDLLGIAEVGGRLGIAKNEIFDFVKVMDKAGVALGDSFQGGAEVVAEKLGKIKGLYNELQDASVTVAFESVGSALNVLGAAGAASEENMADFVTRVGALPSAIKPSIAQALGLGAAFEESGLKAEVAAGNYGKVVSIAARDFTKFAKVMGLPAEEVKKLINTDPTAFFLKFSKSISSLDATELAKTLDYLKLNDNEVKMVLGAAGKNTEVFSQKIQLANKALNEGTSLTDEFNIKNATLAATLERIKKTVAGWFSSESFVKWLGAAVAWLARLIGATKDGSQSMSTFKNVLVFVAKVVAVLTAALFTNVAVQKLVAMWTNRSTEATLLNNIATKASAVAQGIARIATLAYAYVLAVLQGNMVRAAAASKLLHVAMSTTPWGLALAAIAAVVVAYQMFSDEAKEAATAQSILNDARSEAKTAIGNEVIQLQTLINIAKDETASKEARLKAIQKLNAISPEYLGGLTLENIKTLEGTKILDNYIKMLEKKAMVEVLDARRKKIMEERESRRNQNLSEEIAWYDELWITVKNGGNAMGALTDKALLATKRRSQAMKDYQKEIDAINKVQKELLQSNPELITDFGTGGTPVDIPTDKGSGGGNNNKEPKKYDDSYLKDEERLAKELQDLKKANMADMAKLMDDGYQKELQELKNNHSNKLQELRAQLHKEEALKKIDAEIKVAEKTDPKKAKSLKEQKKLMVEANAEINSAILQQEQLFSMQLGKVQEQAGKAEIEKLKEQHEREKQVRETAFLEEINKLNLSEEEKEKRKKQFQEQELLNEEKFLRDLLEKFKSIIGKGSLNNIDFNLLTPEQVSEFEKLAEKLGLSLQQLLDQKKKLSGAGGFDILKGAGTDIFGFSPEQWDSVFKNLDTTAGKIQAVEMVFQGLQQAWGMYSEFLDANDKRQLKNIDKNNASKKRKLKADLDNGYINQAQYKRAIENLDKEKEKAQAEIEYKKAKREKIAAAASVVINTGLGITKAVAAMPLTGGMPWTAIIAAIGAIQLATVLKQPLPAKGYEEGLYPEYVQREQDGKNFKASFQGKARSGLFGKTSYFMVAENGPEMVIDNKTWTRMSPFLKDAIINDIRGIKGYEQGYYPANNMQTTNASVPMPNTSTSTDAVLLLMLTAIQQNTDAINALQKYPLQAHVSNKDYNSMKAINDGINDYLKTRNKAKL